MTSPNFGKIAFHISGKKPNFNFFNTLNGHLHSSLNTLYQLQRPTPECCIRRDSCSTADFSGQCNPPHHSSSHLEKIPAVSTTILAQSCYSEIFLLSYYFFTAAANGSLSHELYVLHCSLAVLLFPVSVTARIIFLWPLELSCSQISRLLMNSISV